MVRSSRCSYVQLIILIRPLLGLYNFVSTLVPLGCAELSPIAIVDSWNLLEWDTHCDYAYWQGEGRHHD